ncbi:MAG: acylphosphatase [Gammaproteobacteria bacterium]|nr:acylphosphatase [Gammaproteobacteria bacterium]
MDSLICRRFLVSGKVQGVFFRASTARVAEQLQLRGWAKNLPDGRVDVLALGSLAAVERLAEWLRQGPPRARVDAVEMSELAADDHDTLADFRTG